MSDFRSDEFLQIYLELLATVSVPEQHECSNQAFISSPLHTNLPYFGETDQKHSHGQAMRAPSTWTSPFLKWLLRASQPNSTTQAVQNFHFKELLCPLATAWPFVYAILLTNFWHPMLQMHLPPPTMKHPWVWPLTWLSAQPHKQLKGQVFVSVYSTMMGWEAKNCFKLNWPQNTHTLKAQLMSLTEASRSIPKIDVCSSQEADFLKKINHEGKGGKQPARSTVSATPKHSAHSHSPAFPGRELIKLLLLNKTGTVAGDDGSCWLYVLICKS